MKGTDCRRKHWIPLGLSLVCFFYYMTFLVRYGEMFYRGSDIVANAAYGMTLFTDVHRAGWAVPKPAHMLIFGAVYWATRDVWFFHLVLIVATTLTVWAGCRLILRWCGNAYGCLAFCGFMMALPLTFRTTLAGGPGCLNVMFLILAVLCADRIDQKTSRILAVAFLSLANLTRPDSWPCTYLIVLLLVGSRLFDRKGPALSRSDLWYLVPLAMPLLWVLLDWRVFGDPLYSLNIVKSFGEEYGPVRRARPWHHGSKVAGYFPLVKSALFHFFSVSSWLSVKTGLLLLLTLAGMDTMFRRERRQTLLLACLLFGTLLFYFVYAVAGILFRHGYIYTVLVCVTLIVSTGVGRLCGLAGHVRPGPVGRVLPAGIACVLLLFLTVGPFQKENLGETIPILKRRAAVARRAQPAIESLVADVRRTPGAPIILTTQWIPPSWVALGLATGKDTFLVERLVAQKRLGRKDPLPDFKGRTVYYCLGRPMRESLRPFLEALIKRSNKREVIYDREGLIILKCTY